MNMIKTLNPQVFTLLHKMYHADTQSLHGQVSDMIDTLMDCHGWAMHCNRVITVYNGAAMDKLRKELHADIAALHRSMGIGYTMAEYPLGVLMDYAVGLLLSNFWPMEAANG